MEETPRKNLAEKLASVLAEVGSIPKSGRNAHHKYDYITEADLTHHIRPLLAKEGVFIFTSVESLERDAKMTTVWLKWTITDGHDKMELLGVGQGNTTDKGAYAAITGAQKYMLYKNFLVTTGDDPESFKDPATSRDEGVRGEPARSTPRNGRSVSKATDAQKDFLAKLMQSSTFSDEDRAKAQEFVKSGGKAEYSKMIERAKERIEEAKSAPVQDDVDAELFA